MAGAVSDECTCLKLHYWTKNGQSVDVFSGHEGYDKL